MGAVAVLAVSVLVLAAWGTHREARARIQGAGVHRLGWRWLSGAAWHGQAVSDEVWSWPGPWFWRMSRPKRAAARTGGTAAVLLTAWSWVEYSQVTDWVLLSVAFCGLVLSA